MSKSDAWAVTRLDTDIPLCESVNIESPEVPQRSWAHHLIPIGIGTPDVESLTSYFARLADAHFVTPRVLFTQGISKVSHEVYKEKFTRVDGLVSLNAKKAVRQINGGGSAAEKWVRRIEELTLRDNLRFLTFLPWREVLSYRTMCRLERAWCSVCLEDQHVARHTIHEQLRWTHRAVRVCPTHKINLETKCQHCKSSSVVLCGKSRPGICPRCNKRLGYHSREYHSTFTGYPIIDMPFEIFVAEQIGELIAVAPHLDCIPRQEVPGISITKCTDLFFDRNFTAFARFFGMGRGVNNYFYKGNDQRINLDLLLRVAFQVGITLLDLLTNENALSGFNPSLSATASKKRLSPRRNKEDVLRMLIAALEEKPPPSLNELAEKLGYSSASTLRRYFPQICDQIKANYLGYTQGKKKRNFSTARRQSDEVIRAALESALKEERPSSLSQIARSLGYTSCQAIRQRSLDLCMALAKKQRELIISRRDRIVGELKQALDSEPPMSLDTVSENLGYKTTAMLRTLYPEECRLIYHRYKEHIRRQFLLKIEAAVRAILIESPPPPLNAALRQIGISDGTLRKYFPKEHKAISARYLEFRQKQSMKNKENDRNKIRAITFDLTKSGIFPSMNAVLDIFTAGYLKRTEVWAIIQQAREEFAHTV